MTLLTKSRYLLGLQCPKYLWISLHEPKKIPQPDKGTQHRFDQGHLIGELAQKLYPEGISIPTDNFKANLEQTQKLLSKKKPLFEPAFMTNGLYGRADILKPGAGGWDIIEVKSSTDVKDINIHDVSFQKYCYEKAGLHINTCYLMHINNEYVRKGDIEPKKLFTNTDITEDVKETSKGISERILDMKKILALPTCPSAKIGTHCNDPYACPIEECWQHIPKNSIFSLYRGGKRMFELHEQGIIHLKDIPANFKLTQKQEIQIKAEKNKKHHIEKEEIRQFLKTLQEPLHFIDFETFSTAIPLFDGIRPYQKVPFQFSLHIQENGRIKHYSFLAGAGDPRKALIQAMKDQILPKGSIIAYNASFEKNVIKDLAEAFPKEKWLLGLNERMKDLLTPFRDFNYYHPEQHGSASIKKVLPAMTGQNYDELEIAQGEEASLAFLDIITGKLTQTEIAKIRKDLEEYCEKDTEAMIQLVNGLKRMVD